MSLARDIMTETPSCCREENTVYEAVRIMKREDCGAVPIVDAEERCIGIITDRDICLRLVLDHLDAEDTTIGEIMSTDVYTCHPDDDLRSVVQKMQREQIRRIPVVDDQDRVVGIITEGDIARNNASNEMVNEFVGAVVQP